MVRRKTSNATDRLSWVFVIPASTFFSEPSLSLPINISRTSTSAHPPCQATLKLAGHPILRWCRQWRLQLQQLIPVQASHRQSRRTGTSAQEAARPVPASSPLAWIARRRLHPRRSCRAESHHPVTCRTCQEAGSIHPKLMMVILPCSAWWMLLLLPLIRRNLRQVGQMRLPYRQDLGIAEGCSLRRRSSRLIRSRGYCVLDARVHRKLASASLGQCCHLAPLLLQLYKATR